MRDLGSDLRYVWRQLRRTRMFTAVAVVTLALGIAAATALAAMIFANPAQPIDIARVDGVMVATAVEQSGRETHQIQIPEFFALEQRPGAAIAAVAAVGQQGQTFATVPGRAEVLNLEQVSGGYADVVDVRPQIGRWISVADNSGPDGSPVVVISDRLWHQWFNADTTVTDHATLGLSRRTLTIVGVAPPGFQGLQIAPTDAWIPLGHPSVIPSRFANQRPLGVLTFVKPRPGVSIDEASAAVRAAIADQTSPRDASPHVRLVPARQVQRSTLIDGTSAVIQGFAALVFLAACANLANMLYARGTERAGEIAVRLSLGATAGRIRRLFLVEAGLIAIAGAVLGLALALTFATAFNATFHLFAAWELRLNAKMSAAALAEGLVAALLVGTLTAWRSSRVPLVNSMTAVGTPVGADRRGLSLRTVLVSVQITAAVLLLITTGIFYENSWKALDVSLDYDTTPVATALIRPQYARRPVTTDEERDREESNRETAARSFFDRLLPALRAMPNVEHAAIADALPGSQASPMPLFGLTGLVATHPPIGFVGRPRRSNVSWTHISPDFFATVGLRILKGRDILASDADGSRIAVVTSSVAEWLWPGEDPLGQEILCCDLSTDPKAAVWRPRRVVGVVADPVHSSDRSPLTRPSNHVFLPFEGDYARGHLALVRGSLPVTAHVDQLRGGVAAIDPNTWVLGATTLDDMLTTPTRPQRIVRVLTMTIGGTALAISVLGVYGVVAFFVTRRRREFGVRLALGATPRRVVKLVVDYAIHIVLVGLLPGVFLASLGTRLFEGTMYKLAPNSIATWVEVPLLILAIGIAAAYLPARRASKIDPNITLREL